jgi:molybdopterin molybdotransferase
MRVWGVTGWKNTGKTTLTERLVAEFVRQGLRVSTVKHAHHATEIDHPGPRQHRHREAGAGQVLVASPVRWALMTELRGAEEPPLDALLARLDPCDLILIEGYKTAPHPKIETHRQAAGRDLLAPSNPTVRAVASDGAPDTSLPVFHLDDVRRHRGLHPARGRAVSAPLTPPRLRNDCFAMPQGVDWVPVDTALSLLRDRLHPVTEVEELPVARALGRVLAVPAVARRSNPPRPNAAVDGYGFAHDATGEGVQRLPLLPGRAAAGQPFPGTVPPGAACAS